MKERDVHLNAWLCNARELWNRVEWRGIYDIRSGNADHSPKQSYSTSLSEKLLALYITRGSYFRWTRCLINFIVRGDCYTTPLIVETRVRNRVIKMSLVKREMTFYRLIIAFLARKILTISLAIQSVFDRVFKK